MVPDAAVKHYRHIQGLQGLAVMAASDLWSEVGPSDLTGSWARHVPAVVSVVSGIQAKAAAAGASYGAATLAQQGLYEAPRYFVDPQAFAGVASDGRSLAGLLYAPVPHTKALIAGGMEPAQALEQGGKLLTTLTRTQVADAGRGAAGVDMATRKNTGFIRMLNPPSCSRCSILAGRFYRWNTGFDRHPRCDCIHVQTSVYAAKTEGLMHDPYEYFHSLSPEDQDRVYTKAGAQAVRDGGDIFQVVNSRRGMKPGGLLTTEGTSKRGNFGKNGPRLTPDAIYSKGLSRAETLKELERYGYILPGGQNPLGVIRGQAEGFGQLGRGGTRVGARESVLRARETGVRDPRIRATMTAAERRAFDAQSNWDAVQAGRDPFTSRKNAPVTPEVAARVELAYRKELALIKAEPRVLREVVTVAPKVDRLAAINSAKSATEAGAALQDLIGKRGMVSGFDAPKLDAARARETAATIGALFEKYPKISANIVVTKIANSKVLAQAGSRTGKVEDLVMEISEAKLKATSKLANQFDAMCSSGHVHVHDRKAVDPMQYTVTHEFGHLIDGTIKPFHFDAVKDEIMAENGWRKHSKEQAAYFRANQSVYGRSNKAEGIAEAFADVEINGGRAFEFSKRVHAALIARLADA